MNAVTFGLFDKQLVALTDGVPSDALANVASLPEDSERAIEAREVLLHQLVERANENRPESVDERVTELCEPDGEAVTHYAPVLQAMADQLNTWHGRHPAKTLKLQTKLFTILREAHEVAALLDKSVLRDAQAVDALLDESASKRNAQ